MVTKMLLEPSSIQCMNLTMLMFNIIFYWCEINDVNLHCFIQSIIFKKKMLPFALQITMERLQHFLEHYQNGEIRINKHNEKYMVLFQK